MTRWLENCAVAAGLIARLDIARLSFLPHPECLRASLIECLGTIGPGNEDLPRCGHELVIHVSALSFVRNTMNKLGMHSPEMDADVIFWRLIVAFLIEAEGAPIADLHSFVYGRNSEERNDAVVVQLRLMCHHEDIDHVEREHRAFSENSPGDDARPRSFRP